MEVLFLVCTNYSPRHWWLNKMESLLNTSNLHFGTVIGWAGRVRFVFTPSPSWSWPSCLSWGIIRTRYVLPGSTPDGNLWTIDTEFGALTGDKSIHFPDSSICILYDVGVSPTPTDSVQASNSSFSSIQLSSTNEILGRTWSDGKTGMKGFGTVITDAVFVLAKCMQCMAKQWNKIAPNECKCVGNEKWYRRFSAKTKACMSTKWSSPEQKTDSLHFSQITAICSRLAIRWFYLLGAPFNNMD